MCGRDVCLRFSTGALYCGMSKEANESAKSDEIRGI